MKGPTDMSNTSLRIVEISGPPLERGRQYGSAAADLITKAIDFYTEAFQQQTGLTWDQLRGRAERWMGLCTETAPDLVTEMRGIAEGSGRDVLDIMVLNLRGEIIYDAGFAKAPEPEERDDVDGCTSFVLTDGASGDGHMYVGQNWDWRFGAQETVMILRVVQDPKPTLIMQVEAGQIGRHGANSAGIALNANGLGGRFNDELGMPQTFIRRMVLDQAELPDALNTLFRQKPHIASNAVLSHRSGFSIDVETTPGSNGWMYPDKSGVMVHGNHYEAFMPVQLAATYRPVSVDSLFRVPQARRGLERVSAATSTGQARELIKSAMSDHLGYPESVCTHPDERRPRVRQWSTLLSSCVDLTTGDYLVTDGTPCDHNYEQMPWNLYDGPGSAHDSFNRTIAEVSL
ncbi:acyl-coenzyme A--6-aminopenicillanic-acid-acyltransferase form [Arthrobacter sp. MYb23]|nr:acyl-coenzyme A--6-aminopenicillanic-acid-acyltransferase form [Arthrobacter sp. MYb51]PRB97351.1 acyl-coenzyme A--6-aminopenicillanic-acid-acyltransferase form [Arthrobacter sp. MYb23]